MRRDNLTSCADGSVNLFVDAGSMMAMMESTFRCRCTLGCQHSISLSLTCTFVSRSFSRNSLSEEFNFYRYGKERN